jgi:hypothetical protein
MRRRNGKEEGRMRWFGSMLVAGFLMTMVGCGTSASLVWEDPCGGNCLADEICWDGACYPRSDCSYDVCAYSDGSYGCTDTSSDPFNCGGCGVDCGGDDCFAGVCQAAGFVCPDGTTDCGNGCVDLSSDPFNCGGCDVWCAQGEVCYNGCQPAGYDCTSVGLVDCGYGCTDLLTDPYNCGQCGVECVNGCNGAGACL